MIDRRRDRLRSHPYRRLILVLAMLAAAGCSHTSAPDLKRLYAMRQGNAVQPPVILIHGLLGSRLADESGREVFPGPLPKLLFGKYRDLRLDIDPDTLLPGDGGLRPTSITDKAAGQDFYGAIMRVLEEAGGFVHSEPGTPAQTGDRRYYVFVYDWRQDNVQSARKLDAFIEQIRRDFEDPELEVDVIAHSMGGLITRYYIRYGTLDTLDDNDFPVSNHGAGRIRRAILLGTPNLGAALPFHGFVEGVQIGLGKLPTEVAATFPSGYQLFPHALTNWLVTPDGKPLDRDLFDVDFWRRFEFSIFDPAVAERIIGEYDDPAAGQAYLDMLRAYFAKHLERARRFVWSLTVPIEEPDVHYVVFGGDCSLTPARVLVEEVDGQSQIRLYPDQVQNRVPGVNYENLMLEPGDGTVTRASLLARQTLDPTVARHEYIYFPLEYAFFLCEAHAALTGNINFQDNLLSAILSVDGP